jgi:hypothetical protein
MAAGPGMVRCGHTARQSHPGSAQRCRLRRHGDEPGNAGRLPILGRSVRMCPLIKGHLRDLAQARAELERARERDR